ncbi:MAG: hypothetical protein LBP75_11200 [Planctomycetota bacterium]|nr:hypothetical protein [Planctomycetota bacterium]
MESGMGEMDIMSGPSYFRTTAWSVVTGAQGSMDAENRDECLARLCSTYWKPVYQYLRRRGLSHEDARDMAQEYFATFLEKNFVASANRERGRFRTFVLVTLHRFYTKQMASKRRRDYYNLSVPVDVYEDRFVKELAIQETAEDEFNRRWAMSLIETTLEKMKQECSRGKKKLYYDVLMMHMDGNSERPTRYKEVAKNLGLCHSDVTNYLFRGRNIFQKLLRDEIRQSVVDEEAVNEEIEALKEYLRD